jgi:hypothetical protein
MMDRDVRDGLWEDFHALVNMSSEQLRQWLLTDASREAAFPADPDLGVAPDGRAVLAVLGKRKMDLTDADREMMRTAVEAIRYLLGHRPPGGAADDTWRHTLMTLGHDPLRAP